MPDPNYCPYCTYRHPVASIVTDHIIKTHPKESRDGKH